MTDYCFQCCMEKGRPAGCGECGAGAPGIEVARHPHYLPPGTPLNHGQYLVGRTLGAGGFGVTYLGVDAQLGMRLAIKELLPIDLAVRAADGKHVVPVGDGGDAIAAGLDGFLREARMLIPFSEHPNVVSILSFFEDYGTAYMVMPYLDGVPLDQFLEERGGRLEQQEALPIVLGLLDALRATHGRDLLHRDIKPQNVFITRDGMVKLLDFGSARQVIGQKTKTMTAVVTDGYAPFEQYQTRMKQGPSTDVYAVGATFYRMLTGQTPQPALVRLTADSLTPPDQVPGARVSAGVSAAVMTALAVKPHERFQSAEAFAAALTADTGPVAAVPAPASKATAPALSAPPSTPSPATAAASAPRSEPRSAPAPTAPAPTPPAAPRAQRSKLPLVAIAAALVIVSGVAFAGYTAFTRFAEGKRAAAAAAESQEGAAGGFSVASLLKQGTPVFGRPRIAQIGSERPLIRDLDGDGTEDMLGRYREYDFDAGTYYSYLAAFSGKDQSELWRSESIGAWPEETISAQVYDFGKTLVLSMSDKLHGHAAADGKRLWTAALSDKPKQIGREGGALRVEAIDGKRFSVEVATGAVTPDGSGARITAPLRGDGPYSQIASHGPMDLKPKQWPGLKVERAYCARDQQDWGTTPFDPNRDPPGCKDPLGLAFAVKSPGTPVPHLVGYDRADRSQRWKLQLSPQGAMRSLGSVPEIEHHGDRMLVIYPSGDVTLRMMERATGKVLWTQTIPKDKVFRALGGVVTDTRVYFHSGTHFFIFDAASGGVIAELSSNR